VVERFNVSEEWEGLSLPDELDQNFQAD